MTRVALIFGGRSPEHEVSLVSARYVHAQLQAAGFTTILVGIDRDGGWHMGRSAVDLLAGSLPSDVTGSHAGRFSALVSREQIDVAFPMIHGVTGEDGYLQGYCELMNMPYVGGDPLNLSLCWDKWATRALLTQHGLPQPAYLGFHKQTYHPQKAVEAIEAKLRYPVFVKPARAGSSIGISKVKQRETLAQAMETAFEYDYRILVEQGLEAREIEIAGLGAHEPLLSIAAEIISENEFYNFEEKYLKSSTEFVIPADLIAVQKEELRGLAQKAWLLLNCYGMARIDFLVTRDRVYLNEINTFPGFTSISMYPRLLRESGVAPPVLMERLVELALCRQNYLPRNLRFDSQKEWYREGQDG